MIEVPAEQYVGAVMEKLGSRKAEIVRHGYPRDTRVEPSGIPNFPARGLKGYRQQVSHRYQRNGIMNSVFRPDTSPKKGTFPSGCRVPLVVF